MNKRMGGIIKEAMNSLKACGGLIEGPTTSAQRRYIADQIVKKSVFAPFFNAMGITRGCQIKRALDYTRSEAFFRYVYQLYCLFWVHNFDRTLLPQFDDVFPESYFNLTQDQLKRSMITIRQLYGATQSTMKVAYYTALGRTDIYKHEKILFSDRLEFLNSMPHETLLNYCITCKDEDAAAAAIVLLMQEQLSTPQCQEFFRLRDNDIGLYLMKHAGARYYLMAFHNIRLSASGNVAASAYYAEDGWIEQITGGRSHRDLNLQASLYAYQLSGALDTMKDMGVLEDTTMTEIFRERQEHMKHHRCLANKLYQMEPDLLATGEVRIAEIPEEVKALAHRLAKIHGPVAITTESAGMHLYIPDPELLSKDGEKELTSRHMAINADKYFGLNRWNVDENPTRENVELYRKFRSQGREVPCCMSMKTGRTTTVEQLLKMRPLEERTNIIRRSESPVIAGDQKKCLVYDEYGNLVPEPPGTVVPLSALEKNHPARKYLIQRGFDPDLLSGLYHVGYCTQALPEDRSKGRYWSKLPAGCRNSPQGRIIFPIEDEAGVKRGWQARAIDYKDNKGNRYLWTDKELWLQIEKEGVDLFATPETPDGFRTLRKYLNAKGLSRNQVVFGIRQAMDITKDLPYDQRVCYVVEGVMDAMKGGAQCLAILGKSMSYFQADVIRRHFGKVLLIADNDRAGKSFTRCIKEELEDVPILEATLPAGKKDLGECSYTEAQELITKALNQ